MKLYKESAAQTVLDIKSGEKKIEEYLETLRERDETVGKKVEAFVKNVNWEQVSEESEGLINKDADDLSLYGASVGVKDIIHADGFPTRANSHVPAEEITGPEAPCVTALREAGGIVIGKTVTTEFASRVPGPTKNPHDIEHTPGGSSSGSAAAVAAGLCSIALGTQTGGSVIRPASFCGVIGFKPSYGRIPAKGVLTISESLDTVGIYTQDIESMQLVAPVVCTDWESDQSITDSPTLGIPKGPYLEQVRPETASGFETIVDSLKQADYEIQAVPLFENIDEIYEQHTILSNAERALAHHERYEEFATLYSKSFADKIESGRDVTVESLAKARTAQEELRDEVESTMEENEIDVWICPSALGTAPEGIDYTGDPAMNSPWTKAGSPSVNLPAGKIGGLPLGLQCVGSYNNDEALLDWTEQMAPVVEDIL